MRRNYPLRTVPSRVSQSPPAKTTSSQPMSTTAGYPLRKRPANSNDGSPNSAKKISRKERQWCAKGTTNIKNLAQLLVQPKVTEIPCRPATASTTASTTTNTNNNDSPIVNLSKPFVFSNTNSTSNTPTHGQPSPAVINNVANAASQTNQQQQQLPTGKTPNPKPMPMSVPRKIPPPSTIPPIDPKTLPSLVGQPLVTTSPNTEFSLDNPLQVGFGRYKCKIKQLILGVKVGVKFVSVPPNSPNQAEHTPSSNSHNYHVTIPHKDLQMVMLCLDRNYLVLLMQPVGKSADQIRNALQIKDEFNIRSPELHLRWISVQFNGDVPEHRTLDHCLRLAGFSFKTIDACFARSLINYHSPSLTSQISASLVNSPNTSSIDLDQSSASPSLIEDRSATNDRDDHQRVTTNQKKPDSVRSGSGDQPDQKPDHSLAGDLKRSFQERLFTDLTIVLVNSNYRIKAHKHVLAARSERFKKLLVNDVGEGKELIVDGFKPNVMDQLIKYIYTDDIDHDWYVDFGCQLLLAADYYRLPGLKALVIKDLIPLLTVNNSLDLLKTADACESSTTKLMEASIKFINKKENKSKVVKLPAFDELCKTHPHLIRKLYEERV